jgi:hypothetical protein
MPAVLANNRVGKPRSLTDALFVTHAPETPLSSKVKKGQSIDQLIHTFMVGRERDPIDDATPDNKPPAPAEGDNPTYEVDCRVGFFEGVARVGKYGKHIGTVGQVAATNLKKATKVTGKQPQLAKTRAQQLERIKWGMEKRMVGESDSAAETPTVAQKFRGAMAWLQATLPTDRPFNSAILIPSGQRYTDTLANLTEAAFDLLFQRRFESTKYAAELVGYFATDLRKTVNTFNKLSSTSGSVESVVRYNTNQSTKMVMRGVDFYEGSFGSVEIHTNPWITDSKDGLVLEMDFCESLPFGPGEEEEALGADGGGDSVVLRSMRAFHIGDPRAHIAIQPSG